MPKPKKDDDDEPMPTIYPPYVIERSSRGERTYDIFSRLLMDRIVFIGTPINDDVANIVIAQLLFLDADNPERDVHLYINSPGGSVPAVMAIYHTMEFMNAPVRTNCMGTAADIEIAAKEILYLRGKMNELFAKHTARPVEQIERDIDRDRFMSADEA